jgi:RNA polymerase sigma-70 factor, ECF subfamily
MEELVESARSAVEPVGDAVPMDVEEVLERVRAGDVEAYASVVRRFQGEVRQVVAFALRDVDGSADLVQQTFVDAFFHLDRFEAGRSFGAWVRGIARNLVREELRRRGREQARYTAYHSHLVACGGDDACAEERERSLREALLRCREELSPPAKRALELRYDRGLDFDGVAEGLGRTVAAARQLLQRVRLLLKHCIEQRLEASS